MFPPLVVVITLIGIMLLLVQVYVTLALVLQQEEEPVIMWLSLPAAFFHCVSALGPIWTTQ